MDKSLPPGWTVRLHEGRPLWTHSPSGRMSWTKPIDKDTPRGPPLVRPGPPLATTPLHPRSEYETPMNDIQRFLSEFDKPEESGKKNLIATAIQSDYDKTRAMLALPALRPDQWDEIKDLVAYMQQQIQQYRLAQAHRHSNIQTVVSHRERPVSTKVVGGLIEAVAPTVQHATRSSRGGMFLLPTPELAAKKKAEGEVDLSTSLVDQLLLAESAKQKAPLLKRLRQMEDEWRAFQALADEL